MSSLVIGWSILISSSIWLFFSSPLCSAWPTNSRHHLKRIMTPEDTGVAGIHTPLTVGLKLSEKKTESLSDLREDSAFLKSQTSSAGDEASATRPNSVKVSQPWKPLDPKEEQQPGALVPPPGETRQGSSRSVRAALKSTELDDPNLQIPADNNVQPDQIGALVDKFDDDDYDYDYSDQTVGGVDDQLYHAQSDLPEYMIHLFHMLEGTHISMLKDTVVTSFANLMHEASTEERNGVTKHMLVFKTHFTLETTQPQHAELRVFLNVGQTTVEKVHQGEQSPEICVHLDVLESVPASPNGQMGADPSEKREGDDSNSKSVDALYKDADRLNRDSGDRSGEDVYLPPRVSVASKDVNISKSRWEGIEVTKGVIHWHGSKLLVFEVRIQNCQPLRKARGESDTSRLSSSEPRESPNNGSTKHNINIDVGLNSAHDPILVVFSKKRTDISPDLPVPAAVRMKRDTVDTVHVNKTSALPDTRDGNHENGFMQKHTSDESFDFLSPEANDTIDIQGEMSSEITDEHFQKDRFEFNKRDELTKINSLGDLAHILDKVEKSGLAKIQGQASTKRYTNVATLETNTNSSNFSQVQAEEISKRIKMADTPSRGTRGHHEQQIESPPNEGSLLRLRRGMKRVYQRHMSSIFNSSRRFTRSAGYKRRRRRRPCRRVPMFVDFAEINWDSRIAYPLGYQAYQCKGHCTVPISDHLSPTIHAVVQSLMYMTSNRRVSRACCVPTRLTPHSIVKYEDTSTFQYHYQYEDMVVAECGCR